MADIEKVKSIYVGEIGEKLFENKDLDSTEDIFEATTVYLKSREMYKKR